MLSKQSKYAIRGMLYLAQNASKENKLTSKQVAEKTGIPVSFLAKIFQKLSRQDLVLAVKGPKGGFYLSEKEMKNCLLDIISCIDGLESFTTCYIGLPHCSDKKPCPVHHVAAAWRDQLLAELRVKTLADLIEETEKGLSRIV